MRSTQYHNLSELQVNLSEKYFDSKIDVPGQPLDQDADINQWHMLPKKERTTTNQHHTIYDQNMEYGGPQQRYQETQTGHSSARKTSPTVHTGTRSEEAQPLQLQRATPTQRSYGATHNPGH